MNLDALSTLWKVLLATLAVFVLILFWQDFRSGRLRQEVQSFLQVIIVCWALRAFVVKPMTMAGSVADFISGFEAGDIVLVLKSAYLIHEPRRGDIVTFYSYSSRYNIVCRVVGLPKERIEVAGGETRVNGKPLDEPYVLVRAGYKLTETVPEGSYFVMPDTRAGPLLDSGMSAGSQDWGCLSVSEIEGQVWFRIWPLNRLGRIDEHIDE